MYAKDTGLKDQISNDFTFTSDVEIGFSHSEQESIVNVPENLNFSSVLFLTRH